MDVNANFGFFNLNNQFQLGKGWSGEIGGFYQTNVPYAQLTLLSRKQLNLGVQKKILQNKGALKLSIRDVFYSFVNAGKINYVQNASGSWTNYLDSRVASLSFSYNFNKGKALKTRTTGGADDEKNRVKNGG
jgi:iron complex outermembrane recepter protein